MLNVVLTGIFYPIAILRYIEQAFARRDDVRLIRVGPYTGNWVPWPNLTNPQVAGVTLPQKYAVEPEVVLPVQYNVGSVPVGFVEAKLKEIGVTPDVWIQVDAGFHLAGRPSQGLNLVIGTDPHVFNNDHYERVRPYADIFFNMQTPYLKGNDAWLPYAYDPVWHRPPVAEEVPEKEYDVVLLGLPYGHRMQLVAALRAAGINVYYDLGPVYEEARTLYWKSRVGVNWSSMDDLNARTFELMALGLPSVQNEVPDTAKFFRRHIDFLPFSALEEAVRGVQELLEDKDNLGRTMARIAGIGVAPHTWDARVQTVMDHINERI